jgi:maltooligosyltrehalose trehalohydrolase
VVVEETPFRDCTPKRALRATKVFWTVAKTRLSCPSFKRAVCPASNQYLQHMFGADIHSGEVEFRVWAPKAQQLSVQLNGSTHIDLQRDRSGVFAGRAEAKAGDRYCYVIGGKCLPDPVSRYLPDGIHGSTQIVDPEAFRWNDEDWQGTPLHEYVIYELHVGTFSQAGTFDGVIDKLEYLRDLGITAIELMPVAAFPGKRNWGYDGVSLYAVQESYGGPEGLKRLVNAAHHVGLGVVLDVVYNHLGNEGNYLGEFGPYFTDKYRTVWGDAINYDGESCEQVRKYIVENALYWIREYHIDALRLDAIQAITDSSQIHIVQEMVEAVQEFAHGSGRTVCVFAESDQNERKLILARNEGGFGLDAVWSDDFHHSLHTLLTRESSGYYQDYGQPEKVIKALNEGFVFQGQHFRTWRTSRGTSAEGIPLPRHIFCIQNHDQVGNRCWGERLGHVVSRGAAKAAAALLLFAPETPLLFMGEEYAEIAPFQFFTDYRDPKIRAAVVEGRKKEFEDFGWEETPNPQDPATFLRSKLTWQIDEDMLSWYRRLLQLRRQFVTHAPRTCHAYLRNREIIVEVPADNASLVISVTMPGNVMASIAKDEDEILLGNSEDDYQVHVAKIKKSQITSETLERAA